jgi:transcriptional regulator with XRE-family HTH domain
MSIPPVAHIDARCSYHRGMEQWKQRFISAKKENGLSFKELAERLQRRGVEITAGAIAHWFRDTKDPKNKRDVNVPDLILLCEVAEIDLAKVIVGATIDELVRKELQRLVDEKTPFSSASRTKINRAEKKSPPRKN